MIILISNIKIVIIILAIIVLKICVVQIVCFTRYGFHKLPCLPLISVRDFLHYPESLLSVPRDNPCTCGIQLMVIECMWVVRLSAASRARKQQIDEKVWVQCLQYLWWLCVVEILPLSTIHICSAFPTISDCIPNGDCSRKHPLFDERLW